MTTMNELENKIKAAQDAYYNKSPIMSDIEFDMLWDELCETYPESELLKNVGFDHTDGFPKHKHSILMGSQNKANTKEEMNVFFRKNGLCVAQLKLDGCSIELEYKHGKFVTGSTRGDGVEGDDITANVLKMNGLVKDLNEDFTGSVRGEVLLDKSVKEKYFSDMKNCRNAASGVMKHLDGADCEKLTIRVYDAQYNDGTSFNRQDTLQTWLEQKGFIVSPWIVFESTDGADAMVYITEQFSETAIANRDYDIDGIVFKKMEIDMNDILTEYRPKTQIALKYKYTLVNTKIIDIEWSVKNGTFTPVAIVEPREIDGTTVQRASMCNVAMLEDLGIEIGHEVTITKAGQIIPCILKNNTTGKSREGYIF